MRWSLYLSLPALSLLVANVQAFPSMARLESVDTAQLRDSLYSARSIIEAIKQEEKMKKRQGGSGSAGPVVVPDPNDEAHRFEEPGPTDQRGPCPGMNALANNGFLPRAGIVTFADLVRGQKEGYNIDYDLGAFLAATAISLDGDLVTTKLSLGGEDSRTMLLGSAQKLISYEPGLNGHNKFEGDTSLTRKDYYLNDGDDFTFYGDMYADMKSFATQYGPDGRYDAVSLATYRYLRYNQSRADNDRFYYGPKAFLLYGASSFVYAAFGNATEDPTFQTSSEASVSSFFGAVEDASAPGGYRHVAERFPSNWYQRTEPYTLRDVVREIGKQYGMFPVQFGANARNDTGRFFVPVPNGDEDPFVAPTNEQELSNYCCAMFQLLFDNYPGTIATPALLLQSQLDFWLGTLSPVFKDSCNCGETPPSPLATAKDPLAEALLPKAGATSVEAGTNALNDAVRKAKASS